MNNQQMMRRPMQGMADQMATHGRYGDSMLVHMNPVEVQGLASLSPTGSLTTNPVTGQPEAFLPFLAPLLGSALGSTFLTGSALGGLIGGAGLSSVAAGAIGSGLATTALTGDIKEGIMSGITGFGLGKAFQGASELMNPEVAKAATDVAGATDAATEAAKLANLGDASASARFDMLTGDALSVDPLTGGAPNMSPLANPITPNMSPNPISGGAVSGSQGSIAYKQNVLDGLRAEAGQNIGQNMMNNPMEFAKNFGSQAIKSGTMIPVAVGEGARAQKMAEDDMKRLNAQFEKDRKAELDRATAVRDASIGLAQNDYNPYGGYMNGGVVSINPKEYMRQRKNVEKIGMADGGVAGLNSLDLNSIFSQFNTSPEAAGQTQRTIRPPNVVTSDQLDREAAELVAQGKDPRAGFRSEINYFRATPEEAGIEDPNRTGPGDSYDPDTTPDIEVGVPDFNIGSKGGTGSTGGLTQDQIDSINNAIGNLDLSSNPRDTDGSNQGRIDRRTGADQTVNPFYTGGVDSSLYDDSNMYSNANSKLKAEDAIDAIGNINPMDGLDPIVPIYGNPPAETMPPMRPIRSGKVGRRAAGGVVTLQEGGIAELDPANEPILMEGNSGMPEMNAPMPMEDGEMQSVIAQVKQAMDQGITPEQLPPELAQKLIQIIQIHGLEAVGSMLQGQPNIPDSNFKPPSQRNTTYSFQEGGEVSPESRLIEQTIAAVLGQVSEGEAEVIITMFIDQFGQEAFQMLREQALQSVVPNAQTEGVIKGKGGGMDDLVNGMIGDEQPVAVSPGEYIVPADVVSGLGDGSTDGGVAKLDGMLDRVRQERTGTTLQPAPMNTGGALPA